VNAVTRSPCGSSMSGEACRDQCIGVPCADPDFRLYRANFTSVNLRGGIECSEYLMAVSSMVRRVRGSEASHASAVGASEKGGERRQSGMTAEARPIRVDLSRVRTKDRRPRRRGRDS